MRELSGDYRAFGLACLDGIAQDEGDLALADIRVEKKRIVLLCEFVLEIACLPAILDWPWSVVSDLGSIFLSF